MGPSRKYVQRDVRWVKSKRTCLHGGGLVEIKECTRSCAPLKDLPVHAEEKYGQKWHKMGTLQKLPLKSEKLMQF